MFVWTATVITENALEKTINFTSNIIGKSRNIFKISMALYLSCKISIWLISRF